MIKKPLGSSFIFLTTAIWLTVTDDKVLMVMTTGDGSDANTLWHTEGGINETYPDMADWSVRDLLSIGTFRSSVVDLWPYGNPEEVKIEAVNANGDILWWVTFSTIGTEKAFVSWLKPQLILTSSSHDMIETSDRQIYLGVPDTELLFALASDKNLSWSYVNQSGSIRPRFFLTRNNTSPQDMYPTNSGSQWWNDYVFENLPDQQLIQVDLASYSDTGNSYIFLTRQCVNVFKLFSIYSLVYNIYYSLLPCTNDWGVPYLDDTGQTMNFTTKLLTYDIHTIAVQCLTINILEPIPTSVTVSFTGKTVKDRFVEAHALVVLGYWPNGTFPTEFTSSTSSNVETTAETTTTEPPPPTTAPTTRASPPQPTTSTTTSLTTTTETNIRPLSTTTTTAKAETTTQTSAMTTTSTSTSNTELTTTYVSGGEGHVSAAANTAQCLCICSMKANTTALSMQELQTKLAQIRKELTVNYTTLSSYIRKLNSMPDSRTSAQGIGIMGVGIITLFLFFIVFLDLQFLVKTAKTVKYNLGGSSERSI